MKISTKSWQDLRDFTRECLFFETPSGHLGSAFFTELADRLKNTSEQNTTKFFEMVGKWDGEETKFLQRLDICLNNLEVFKEDFPPKYSGPKVR